MGTAKTVTHRYLTDALYPRGGDSIFVQSTWHINDRDVPPNSNLDAHMSSAARPRVSDTPSVPPPVPPEGGSLFDSRRTQGAESSAAGFRRR